MAKISACIISFNEEDDIAACLESVEGVVDEIVVVDSLSTDTTVEIASRFTDHVVAQEFLGHIAQKQLATDRASNEWILSLDCDERLSQELRASILEEKPNLGPFAAYAMNRRMHYVDRWMKYCFYPNRKVRLFDRKRCGWGGRNPHDIVQVHSGQVGGLRGDILHYSFRSVSDHVRSLNAHSDIAARELVERGVRVGPLSPVLHGLFAFGKSYVLKRGFLDGFPGLVASSLIGLESSLKHAKARYMRRGRSI